MPDLRSASPDPAPALELRDRAFGIMATGTVLALLYFGRDVLIPITLAVILSLLMAPLVRRLRRIGLGQTSAALMTVAAFALVSAAVAAVIGVQVVRMAASLPLYEETIQGKVETLNRFTVGSVSLFTDGPARVFGRRNDTRPEVAGQEVSGPIPVELHVPPTNPVEVVRRVLASVWTPVETAGIVLVVLIFVLLEHEALRDRFIRITGGADIRASTLALNDAGERLSRFFVSQFAVNLSVGVGVWIGLSIVQLPHAALWGALAAVLRFLPYVGIWIAAVFSTILAAAVDPGWSMAISTMALFIVVELIVGQLIEPQLYGHTTGLSPLSVVIAAIFWSWLWGPIGLILSTPLTLCLLVAGRHIKALSLLDILLGDAQALTMPQRVYQRALSGDSDEVIENARSYLKRNSFAAYCDSVLMPALQLARMDMQSAAISQEQMAKVRQTVLSLVKVIGDTDQSVARRFARRRARISVLDNANVGRALRREREAVSGRWQGPLAVPAASIMLCMGLGTIIDDLATELLVRILRGQKIDARHLAMDELKGQAPPDSRPDSVAMVFVISAFPDASSSHGVALADDVRSRLPQALLVSVVLQGMLLQPGLGDDGLSGKADKTATSFGHAVQICLNWQREKSEV